MGLDDDIIIPDFPDDDEDFEPAVAAEQQQNRTFLIASAVLAGIFILGLCVALYLILGPGVPGAEGERAAIEQTNAARIAAATETALAALAPPTATPPEEVAEGPTATSTEAPTATPTPLLVATQTEEPTSVEDLATLSDAQVAQGTTTPFATLEPSLTPLATIEVTQIGGADTPAAPGLPTPTRIVSGVNGGTGSTGGAIVTATALPSTGIGIAGGVAGIGLLALVLVAVVFVARRLRLQQ